MDQMIEILKRLTEHQVEYVLVGGMAAVAHGSSMVTKDVDVCAPLGEPNLSKILNALREIHPKLRMRPDRMPLPDDPDRLQGLNNLYLVTDFGVIDFLGELTGVGHFDEVVKHSRPGDLGGFTCQIIDLDTLITAKRAAGRAKDMRALPELEALRQRRENSLFPDNP
jgi:predicted nucleotidyltransferase